MNSTLSKSKKFTFFALAFLIPVLLLVLVEAGLRLVGYGDDLRLFIPLEKNPQYRITNPQVGRRYFVQQNFLPATSYDAFRADKPAGTCRIFVLGGSTTAGFPYFNNGAFPRMLRLLLQERHPGTHFEVINLGLPAVNSYTLLDFADEITNFAPDAVLVYAGHNEFYGAFGSGSTETIAPSRGLINLFLRLQHFKVVQLLRDGIFAVQSTWGRAAQADGGRTLMARMVGKRQIPIRSKLYRKTLAAFRANMAGVVATLQKRGVPVLLSELVSNLRDQPPFASVFSDSSQRQAWEEHFQRGVRLAAAGDCDSALAEFGKARQIDAAPAELYFQVGRCEEQAGQFDSAGDAYLQAKDRDALRFRASEDFNAAIRDLARQFRLPLVPMQQAFASRAPHGIIDSTLMLDHLHPNLQGAYRMAVAFCQALEQASLLPGTEKFANSPFPLFSKQRFGMTSLDEELAKIRLQVLLRNWPFAGNLQNPWRLDYRPQNRLQELALAQWQEKIGWDAAHMQLAEFYQQSGQPELAAQEYRALVIGMPYAVTPYLRLGLTHLHLQQVEAAHAVFRQSLAVQPTAVAYKWLGAIELQKGELQQGIEHLQYALAERPADAEILYNLAVGYARSGQFARARSTAKTLLRLQPKHPGAQAMLRQLASMTGSQGVE